MSDSIVISPRIENMSAHADWIVKNTIIKYMDTRSQFIRDKYLNGQALQKVTGDTYQHFGSVYSKKTKTYIIRPGLGIPGNQNYLARWAKAENLKFGHNFIGPGRNYVRSQEISDAIEKRIEKEL
jgi:hypothetical protein